MLDFLVNIQNTIQTNPLVLGLFGSTIIGVIVYALREYPKRLFFLILDSFTITLTIIQDDNQRAYYAFEHELNNNKWYYITGRFHLIYKWIDKTLKVGCGENSTFITKLGKKWCVVSKHTDQNVSFWHMFYYRVRFFTRNRKYIDQFFQDIYHRQNALSEGDTIKVYQWVNNCWESAQKRKVDMLLNLSKEKSEVISKLAYFLNNQGLYEEYGRPYKEGFILSGDPGCGKSYFILQAASAFDLNIYYVNLRSFVSDMDFIKAIMQVSLPSIILIEDIDCNQSVLDRDKEDKKEKLKDALQNNQEAVTKAQYGVSLSTILNIFDGLLSQDGQIICITTNHLDKLDPALIRTGRFNTNLIFKPLDSKEICEYLNHRYKVKSNIINQIQELTMTVSELSALCDNKTYAEVVHQLTTYIN